jgi:hypothetical protein
MISASTVAKIGRLIKNFENMVDSPGATAPDAEQVQCDCAGTLPLRLQMPCNYS